MFLGTAIYLPLAAMTAASGGLFVADLSSQISSGTNSTVIDPNGVLLPLDSRFVGIPKDRVVDAGGIPLPTLGARLLQSHLAGIEGVPLQGQVLSHVRRFDTEAFFRFLFDHLGFNTTGKKGVQNTLPENIRLHSDHLPRVARYRRIEEGLVKYGVVFSSPQGRSFHPFETLGVYQWGRYVVDITSPGSRSPVSFDFDEDSLISDVVALFQDGVLSKFSKTQTHLLVEREFRDLNLNFVYPSHVEEGYETLGVEVKGRYIGEVDSFTAAGISEFMPAHLSAAVTRLMMRKGVLTSRAKRAGGRGARPSEKRAAA